MKNPENFTPNERKKVEKVEKIENKELSVEKFAEIVYRNGQMLSSEMNTRFVGQPNVRKEDFTEDTQAVFLFNNELYLVKFKANLGSQGSMQGYPVPYWSFSLKPAGVEKLKNPTEQE